MTLRDVARARERSQRISHRRFPKPLEVVEWMGAIQAQDLPMSKTAVGARLSHASLRDLEVALDEARILRTHALRPTWHLVTAADARGLLALTAPHIRAAVRSRHRQLELVPRVLSRSARLLERALRDGVHLTREELTARYRAADFATDDNRIAHLLMLAELDCLICSGVARGGTPTYALMDERVPPAPALPRDEALAALAKTYFRSRGPATVEDFAWWSGLPTGDARRAADIVRGGFAEVRAGSRIFLATESSLDAVGTDPVVSLLPAYDELLVSYADRSAAVANAEHARIVMRNGFFRPIIVRNGRVIGTWRLRRARDARTVETFPFTKFDAKTGALVDGAARRLRGFLGFAEPRMDRRRPGRGCDARGAAALPREMGGRARR